MKIRVVENVLDEAQNFIFQNNMDKRIIENVKKNLITQEITNNNIACFNSAPQNALFFVSKGEEVYFILGNQLKGNSNIVTHCWVKHNDKISETGAYSQREGLFPLYKLSLISCNVEQARHKIINFIDNINKENKQ